MAPFRQLPVVLVSTLLALPACGGRSAGAQTPAPPDDGLAHPYLYWVPDQQEAPRQAPPFIQVSGQGHATVAPDRARAVFAVETREESAAEAASTNAEAMDAVLAALRGAAIPGLSVETYGYSLQPQYSYPTPQGNNRTREIVGYVALNNVRVTVGDVSAVGRVIDTAVQAGANRVASLSFEASDPEAARSEALAEAVRSARAQAEAIASAMGRRLGPALEVHGGADVPGPRPMMDVMYRAAEAAPTPIEPGEQTVTANVTIRFALEVGGQG